jgi:ribosome biogenesis protein MAK21
MTDRDSLRAGLSRIMAGGSMDDTVDGDAFAERNEWEEEQRRLKRAEKALDAKPSARPKSRRAQQDAAKAARNGESIGAGDPEDARGRVNASKSPPSVATLPSVAPADRSILPVCASWWEETEGVPANAAPSNTPPDLRMRAATAYEAELGAFALLQRRKHGSDQRIVQKMSTAGTMKDRIAALTLQAQESSFHCLPHLRALLSLCERPAREAKLAATEALTELFLHRLLPPERALTPFEKARLPKAALALASSSSASTSSSAHAALLRAHFEATLKECYARFVTAVEAGAHDSVSFVKQRMIGTLYALLSGKPELERRLLSSLVNKLGDPDRKAASRLAHLLGQLTIHHPAMKPVVLAELQRFVLRPNVSESSQYYASVFLNQLILTRADPQLAHTLLLIFLALFSSRVSATDGQALGSRMLSSILSGLHRAIPFCDDPATRAQTAELLTTQLTPLFRCAHASSFGTAVQALMVLSHAAGFAPATADRFSRALYASLLHPELPTSGKQALLLNVVYKTMKADEKDARVAAFAKRLLQACAHAPPTFICGALLLLSEVGRRRPSLRTLFSAPPEGPPTLPAEGGKEGGEAAYEWNKRDPAYCGAGASRLWELRVLASHFHPSVVQFAKSLEEGDPISYSGDPLRDFGLMPFLDKFVFKNPKSSRRKLGGGSIMQPHASEGGAGAGAGAGGEDVALSSKGAVASLIAKPIGKVAAHERFFHTYFSRKKEADEKLHRAKPGGKKAAVAAEGDGDDELGAEGEAFATRLAQSLMRDADPDDDDSDGEDDGFGASDDERDDDGSDDDDDFDFGDEGEEGESGEDEDEDEDEDEESMAPNKAEEDGKRKKRKKGGPTFASAEEFAHILEAAADENEGVHPRLAEWEGGKRKKRRF